MFTLKNRGSIAFTLAEVLITLGIIGIVATMTIPTLMQKSQKRTVTSKVLKVISEVSQAALLAQNDGQALPDYTLGGDSPTLLKNYLLPYLKVAKKCEAGETDCGLTDFLCLHKGDNGLSLDPSVQRYILDDGTAIGFYKISNNMYALYFDVNGLKKPNVAGYDVFIMVLYSDPLKMAMFGADTVNKTGTVYDQCDDAHTGSGVYCFMRFRAEGNQITWWNE